MPAPAYTIVCKTKEMIAPGVYDISFNRPEGFTFKAGQFVLFDVPLVDNLSDIQPRAYSIASAPFEQDLRFIIKITPGGRTSTWIETMLTVGSEVVMKGPFGFFVLKPEKTDKDYVFIATGTGVGPFRSHILWMLKEQKDHRSLHLIFGVREKQDLFWVDEFMALQAAHPNFHFHTSLTSGDPDWDGHKGRVHQIATQIIPDFSCISLYICGMPNMVNDVKKIALEEWKMLKADVHAEGYI